jgi:hypothetical protein
MSEVEMVKIDNVCFWITDKSKDAVQSIDVRQFSVLIDAEQATLNLSAFIRFGNATPNDEISMTILFIHGEGILDDERSITSKYL